MLGAVHLDQYTIKYGVEKIIEIKFKPINMLLTNELQLMRDTLIHWCFCNNYFIKQASEIFV